MITTVLDGNHHRALAVHDQGRDSDTGQRVAQIGFGDHLEDRAGLTRRLCAVPRDVPPAAEGFVVGNAGRDGPQHVKTLLDRIRIQCHSAPGIVADHSGADGVVRRPQRASRSVHEHKAAHPLGSVSGQRHAGHPRPARSQDHRLLAPRGIHHRDRVLGPISRSERLDRRGARRCPHSPLVEPDHPGERGEAAVESVKRRLGVD